MDQKKNGVGTPPGAWIDWAEIEGPFPLPENIRPSQILFPKPQSWTTEQYAREVILRFATDAFRGEVPSSEFLAKLFQRYLDKRSKGEPFKRAILEPIAVILASPNFLYLAESSGSNHELTQRELAIRLSYFLWSAPPDHELMALAQAGNLADPEVLRAQTTRLLVDPRSSSFLHSFLHQWLEMERLEMFEFKGSLYRGFDNATRASAREEIYQTFRHLVDQRMSLKNLIETDFVVINNVLADYYGLSGVQGHHFRRVDLPETSPRGGLLTTAAVLAMGSDGIRSSPVERGAWVLRHLMNDPPPPAPANVPQLNRLDDRILSARDLQRAHMEQPQCAQCHNKIDPIGYGLENFDAAGSWREEELVHYARRKTKTFPIDPSGRLSNGTPFKNHAELRSIIASHFDDFAQGFTEALIAYGLGRPYGFTDHDLAQTVAQKAALENYNPTSFIHALVQSRAFQTK